MRSFLPRILLRRTPHKPGTTTSPICLWMPTRISPRSVTTVARSFTAPIAANGAMTVTHCDSICSWPRGPGPDRVERILFASGRSRAGDLFLHITLAKKRSTEMRFRFLEVFFLNKRGI